MDKKVDKLKIKHVHCKVCDKLLSIHSMKKHKKIHKREERRNGSKECIWIKGKSRITVWKKEEKSIYK